MTRKTPYKHIMIRPEDYKELAFYKAEQDLPSLSKAIGHAVRRVRK